MDEKRTLEHLVSYLPKMLSGEELKQKISCFPPYNERIRMEHVSGRLMALNSLYDVYIPNVMSAEIYSKIYLATLRSLQKKGTKLAIQQKNINGKVIQGCQGSSGGICGGSDSFTIIAPSGVGKSSAINRAVLAMNGNEVIETEHPFCKIIPAIQIQTPFDSSVKNMLLSILKQVDMCMDSHYYDMAVKARATTDMLIGSVSQVCLNHVGLLIVDEIQNVIRHRSGLQLIGALTQLINQSGISICMVGVPEVEPFFEQIDYLSRRALGLHYKKAEYDERFRELCEILFSYQYVKHKSVIDEGLIHWLYEHSGGTTALLVTLMHDAQEISILNGYERLDLNSLNMAYEQRMGMMHMHIQPSVNVVKGTVKKEKETIQAVLEESGIRENNIKADSLDLQNERYDKLESVVHPCNQSADAFDLVELAEQAKRNGLDMLGLLKGKISITEVVV